MCFVGGCAGLSSLRLAHSEINTESIKQHLDAKIMTNPLNFHSGAAPTNVPTNQSPLNPSGLNQPPLSQSEFIKLQQIIYSIAGIHMTEAKKPLMSGRLYKRLRHHQLTSYADYISLLSRDHEELRVTVDLLTTNETHFFREPKHFTFLQQQVLPNISRQQRFRCWSAASSSGQEAYSLAMLLHDQLGSSGWEVYGSDISSTVLDTARKGLYPIKLAEEIPTEYLKSYCLKGVGQQEGQLKIDPILMNKVRFDNINLNEKLPDVGMFDVIFLRNILIYFQQDTKRAVVARLLEKLKPNGHLVIGHSETLYGMFPELQPLAPSIYRKII